MDMLKKSDMWIADSGASNHVTFSDKGCRNKRIATGMTHGIVGNSVLPKCALDIRCVHFDKDGSTSGRGDHHRCESPARGQLQPL